MFINGNKLKNDMKHKRNVKRVDYVVLKLNKMVVGEFVYFSFKLLTILFRCNLFI